MAINPNLFKKLVKEELDRMLREAAEKAPDYNAKLEELRKKLVPELSSTMAEKVENKKPNTACRTVSIYTVAEILDVPVNELMLHFMNEFKASNIRNSTGLVEYHSGLVHFYAE